MDTKCPSTPWTTSNATAVSRRHAPRQRSNQPEEGKSTSTRIITGNLAADPEVVEAGSIIITTFRVRTRGSTAKASG